MTLQPVRRLIPLPPPPILLRNSKSRTENLRQTRTSRTPNPTVSLRPPPHTPKYEFSPFPSEYAQEDCDLDQLAVPSYMQYHPFRNAQLFPQQASASHSKVSPASPHCP